MSIPYWLDWSIFMWPNRRWGKPLYHSSYVTSFCVCVFVVLMLWVLVTFLTHLMSTSSNDSVPYPTRKVLPRLYKILYSPWRSILLLRIICMWLIWRHYFILTFIPLHSCLSLWCNSQRSRNLIFFFTEACGCVCTYTEVSSRTWDIMKYKEW